MEIVIYRKILFANECIVKNKMMYQRRQSRLLQEEREEQRERNKIVKWNKLFYITTYCNNR